jgi:hypothetical protein
MEMKEIYKFNIEKEEEITKISINNINKIALTTSNSNKIMIYESESSQKFIFEESILLK